MKIAEAVFLQINMFSFPQRDIDFICRGSFSNPVTPSVAQLTDTNCCPNTDSVYIQFAELSFPNAFRPGSSLVKNQEFGVIGDVSSLAQYVFQVYDRWGLLLFETKNPQEKWNGTFPGGEPAPQGIYVWHSVFTTFESCLQAAKEIENRGTVMLLR
ncbi:MAG: hypothetical protein A2W85_00975 [Bacteroidetes bacterium GWF2_41_31]|nr:MAG: hypothetical protein A2W85_00975 [Bacteroidetes bacterium GWF2_41_31]